MMVTVIVHACVRASTQPIESIKLRLNVHVQDTPLGFRQPVWEPFPGGNWFSLSAATENLHVFLHLKVEASGKSPTTLAFQLMLSLCLSSSEEKEKMLKTVEEIGCEFVGTFSLSCPGDTTQQQVSILNLWLLQSFHYHYCNSPCLPRPPKKLLWWVVRATLSRQNVEIQIFLKLNTYKLD